MQFKIMWWEKEGAGIGIRVSWLSVFRVCVCVCVCLHTHVPVCSISMLVAKMTTWVCKAFDF